MNVLSSDASRDHMNAELFGRFRSSLLRCLSNLRFLDRFYSEFLSSSHEVKEAFSQTDMERQKAMLNASMYQLMNLYEKPDDQVIAHIQELGAHHGKHALQIPAHLYDLWLESLLVAVSASDPEYDHELEKIWREVMSYGIDMMKKSWDRKPSTYASTRLKPDQEVPDVDVDKFTEVIRQLNQLSKEAALRSNSEKDLEAMAFQFGQYRAYLHASQLMVGLLKKKSSF